MIRTLLIVGLDLERSCRPLTGPVRERLAADEMGDLVSGVVAPWVAHDALHLIVTNPVTGTVSFGFWHGYPRDLAYAEMRNAYLGDDPLSPQVLAARHMSVGVLNALAPDDLQARAILRAHRIGSELRLMLRDTRAVWGILCLFRGEGGCRFNSEEAEKLRWLTPALIAALRGYVTATPMPLLTQCLPAGVILFDANHEMQGVSAQAEAWLAALHASEWLSCPQWAPLRWPAKRCTVARSSACRPHTPGAGSPCTPNRWARAVPSRCSCRPPPVSYCCPHSPPGMASPRASGLYSTSSVSAWHPSRSLVGCACPRTPSTTTSRCYTRSSASAAETNSSQP